MRSEGGQVQHHEGAAGLAVGGRAAQGGLEEVGQLLVSRLAIERTLPQEGGEKKSKKEKPHTLELR